MRDPKGNIWWIQTHVKDASPEEMEHPSSKHMAAMQEAMSTLDREMSRRGRK